MKQRYVRTTTVSGTNYQIGFTLGKRVQDCPELIKYQTQGFTGFDSKAVVQAQKLFGQWCPGLTEELTGFADALKVPPEQIFYYGMTYLRPNCSQIALAPSRSQNGHPLLARNYEFNDTAEDFQLIRTQVAGRYQHLGTSVLNFGRDDGMNEHGLAVSMSSCGFPVGAPKSMRQPKITGLQFWAVIRSVLENCRDVAAAIQYVQEMPIAYNLNLMLVDRSGQIALVETIDGRLAVKRLEPNGFLLATNHPVIDELIPFEPQAMTNSLVRYQLVEELLAANQTLSVQDLKKLLLTHYPEGLCCHYYRDFFGTTKSMLLDPIAGTIDICWVDWRRMVGENTQSQRL